MQLEGYLGNKPNVYVPCYFKNSSVVLLDTLEGSASMTLVSGGDVYVVGDVVDAAHHSVAKCWKNGVLWCPFENLRRQHLQRFCQVNICFRK